MPPISLQNSAKPVGGICGLAGGNAAPDNLTSLVGLANEPWPDAQPLAILNWNRLKISISFNVACNRLVRHAEVALHFCKLFQVWIEICEEKNDECQAKSRENHQSNPTQNELAHCSSG